MPRSRSRVRIFSALEVANLCGVVNQTAINWIRNGYLKAFSTPGGQYRVYAEDLAAFMADRGMHVPVDMADGLLDDRDWSTIAVVDDDRVLNDLVKRYFENSDSSYTIYQAFDGFEAGALLAERRPGFVFLDIDLPGVDGHRICRRIKTDPAFGKPFVIAITGLDDPGTRDRILANGADAFMAKPLDLDALSNTVADLARKVREPDGHQ